MFVETHVLFSLAFLVIFTITSTCINIGNVKSDFMSFISCTIYRLLVKSLNVYQENTKIHWID